MTDPSTPTRPDRDGKRMVAGYIDAEAFRAFKVLLAKHDLTTDAAVTHAVALLFKHYGEAVPRTITQRLKTLGL